MKKAFEEIILRNTGIPASQFIKDVRDPYIYNLSEAVDLLKKNISKTIHIIGDYDSDGINATAIMYHGLNYYGFKTTVRLPLRFSEGYGLSEKIIDEIDDGIILTVDNGIAAIDAVKKAKQKGLTVIVTDHHQAAVKDGKVVMPEADIIVDPAVEDKSEFHDYCGAAIAYRFIKELLPKKLNLAGLMVLASIATVTDVMPLTGANRTLVKDGLEAINHGRGVAGLRALLERLEKTSKLTEEDYGFLIGPIFNASGRLYDDGASKMLDLLLSKKENPILPYMADKLINTNNYRKEVLKNSMEVAVEKLDGEKPIVVYDPSFGEGIIGLIAGRFCEDFHCPVVVFTKAHNGLLKGSGRSIKEIHLKKILDSIQDKIVGYGGHAGAAGLSIREEDLDAFTEAFKKACGKIPEPADPRRYDVSINSFEEILEFIEEQKKYAPYGEGNPQIRVKFDNYCVNEFRAIGDGTHLLLKGDYLDSIGFGMFQKYQEMGFPKHINLYGYLKESWFRDKVSYKMELEFIEKRN